jgi:hypothetical protein
MVASPNHRLAIARVLRSFGVPVRVINNGYDLGGVAGIVFAFGNQKRYFHHGVETTSPSLMLGRLASMYPRRIPVLLRRVKGEHVLDTVVSMRLADAGPLLGALVESDPERFIINIEED